MGSSGDASQMGTGSRAALAPSGGPYPANGVMTYYSGNENGGWLDTCTLPNSEHALCTVALNAFVSFYGNN